MNEPPLSHPPSLPTPRHTYTHTHTHTHTLPLTHSLPPPFTLKGLSVTGPGSDSILSTCPCHWAPRDPEHVVLSPEHGREQASIPYLVGSYWALESWAFILISLVISGGSLSLLPFLGAQLPHQTPGPPPFLCILSLYQLFPLPAASVLSFFAPPITPPEVLSLVICSKKGKWKKRLKILRYG